MNRIDGLRGPLAKASVTFGLSAFAFLLYVAIWAQRHRWHYRCPGPEQPWALFVAGLVCTAVAVMFGALPATWPSKDAERGWGKAQFGTTILWLGLVLVDVVAGLAALYWLVHMQCGLD